MPGDQGLVLVLDTGPAIALDRLGYGGALEHRLPGRALLPSTVARELRTGAGRPGAGLVERIHIVSVTEERIDVLRHESGAPASVRDGELGTIALTQDLRRDDPATDLMSVIDDLAARKLAIRTGLTPATGLTGTLGVLRLLHAYSLGAAPLAEEIALLQAAGYRFSPALVHRALQDPPSRQEGVVDHWLAHSRHVSPRSRREPVPERRGRSIR